MDIDLLKEKKKQLTCEISNLIADFERDTKTTVAELSLDRYEVRTQPFGESFSSALKVNIIIEIHE